MRKAIGIHVTKARDTYDLGASKFFGAPTIPGNWLDTFGEDELFLCQIRCRDIAALDPEQQLPHTGYLYLFLNVNHSPYQPRVRYFDGEPDTVVDGFNDELEGIACPTDAWLMSFSEAEEDAEGLRLLGIPADWSYAEPAPAVLLQYDPLASDMGFLDSLDGYGYFLFGARKDDWTGICYREERS